MKIAILYFTPDNIIRTRINGTIEEITNYYKYNTSIKGLEIYSIESDLLYSNGDCNSKY